MSEVKTENIEEEKDDPVLIIVDHKNGEKKTYLMGSVEAEEPTSEELLLWEVESIISDDITKVQGSIAPPEELAEKLAEDSLKCNTLITVFYKKNEEVDASTVEKKLALFKCDACSLPDRNLFISIKYFRTNIREDKESYILCIPCTKALAAFMHPLKGFSKLELLIFQSKWFDLNTAYGFLKASIGHDRIWDQILSVNKRKKRRTTIK